MYVTFITFSVLQYFHNFQYFNGLLFFLSKFVETFYITGRVFEKILRQGINVRPFRREFANCIGKTSELKMYWMRIVITAVKPGQLPYALESSFLFVSLLRHNG